MSGIAGIIHFDGKPVEPGLIEKMTAAMAHRGPDGINHWVKGSVALGQCMLRTTPESLEEHQPLTNEDESLVLVMDGRVDNWEELRRHLLSRGATLRSRADAELVLHAYEIWGRDGLAHIDGDFALVLWDARRQSVFCARDRMGNKPFHYHWNNGIFVFASEVQAILSLPWVPRHLNEGMLAEVLADERYSREETFWNGILRLAQAHELVVTASGPRCRQYWEPDPWAKLPYKSDTDYIDHYRELVFDSVRRMSRSHRPVAYEVSGGLDSSAMFCIAAHLQRVGKLGTPGLEGYTLAFCGDDAANELEYARAVGEHLGLPIHEVVPTLPPLTWYYERARIDREFPGYPNGPMSLGLRQLARSHGAAVLVSGVGGDEWLGDASGLRPYYVEDLAGWRFRELLSSMTTDYRDFGLRRTAKWFVRYGVMKVALQRLRRYVRRRLHAIRKPNQAAKHWLSMELHNLLAERREAHLAQPFRSHRPGLGGKLKALQDPYITWAIETEERAAARIGLEQRAPLRRPDLVCFCFATPSRLLTRGRLDKYTHRKAMSDLLPDKVLTRTTKAEFSVVMNKQLSGLAATFAHISQTRSQWFSEWTPATLYDTYSTHTLRSLGLRSEKIMWWLSGVIGCDGLAD